MERLRVTPVSRLAILLGRVLKDAVVLVLQTVPLIVAGYLLGMAADPLGVLAAVVLVLIAVMAPAPFSYVLALALPNEYLFAPVVNSAAIPLMLLSGILLPLDGGPAWLEVLTRLNPLRYVVDAARTLFAGTLGTPVYTGFAVAGLLAVASFTIGSRLFTRRTA